VKTPTVRSLRQAQQVREVFDPISDRLKSVEVFIAREIQDAQPMVSEVAGYVLTSGGKRIRPALVLLISKALGAKGERDVRYGAVVEFIHSATLIHDDIIDESDLRRGKPTANKKWGNQTTVLVGDWLYTRSMALCLEFGDVDVMRLLTAATLQMTEGEIMADQVRYRIDLPEETYMEITRRKTAELFAAACAIPALFQPATLHITEPLQEFGRDLGLCFQLVDDLLDFTSNRSRLGKPVLADLREGRVTLPIILLLPRLNRDQKSRLERVVMDGAFEAISEQEVLEIVRTSGVLDEVQERAQFHAQRAADRLDCLPPSPERDSLAQATSLLVEREV
jgi:octaprenyl-diphosphate synthase